MMFGLGKKKLKWDVIALKIRMISLELLFEIPKNNTYAEKCEK